MGGAEGDWTDLGKWARKVVDRSSDLNPRNMRLGMYAWVIQRLSGLYLVFFLLTHITAIAQANFGITTGSMASVFDVLRNPFWAGGKATIAFDFVALAIIAFHGLNGIRIVFLDLGFGVQKHRTVFWVTMMIAIALTALIITVALPMLPGQ
jgi:succinate dehydrogenase / fumarate reductase cytochrome b subunit